MLRTRLVTALLLGPLILAIVFLGEPWLSLLVGIVAFLALVEVVALLDAAGYQPPQVLGIMAGIALTAAGLVSANEGGVGGGVSWLLTALDPPGLVAATLIAAILLLGAVAFTRSDPVAGFQTWAMTTFGIAYIGLLLPTIVLVAHLAPPGGSWNTPVGAFGLGSGAAWALTLILIGANVAALNFAVLSFHTLCLNRALLPEPLRPPLWREVVVALGGLAFAGLVGRVLARVLWGL